MLLWLMALTHSWPVCLAPKKILSVCMLSHLRLCDLIALRLPKGCALVGVELTDDAVELPVFRHPHAAAYVLGRERGALLRDGERSDMLIMGVLRSEWKAQQGAVQDASRGNNGSEG